MGGYRVFFWVLSAHCMLFAKMLPAFLETPCGSQTPTLSEPQLPVVAFSCLEAGGFQECGINITREVFQAWLKDPEFVPQHHGGWVAESVAGWEVPLERWPRCFGTWNLDQVKVLEEAEVDISNKQLALNRSLTYHRGTDQGFNSENLLFGLLNQSGLSGPFFVGENLLCSPATFQMGWREFAPDDKFY